MADPHSSHSSKLPKATTLGSGLDQALPHLFNLPWVEIISALIDDIMVSVSNMNSVLFIIDKLPIIDKAETLMASLFPVWLTTKLPVDDCDHIKFHNALTALCRFCNFLPTGYDLCPYTTVSPVPPGTILPPALSPTHVTDDHDMDMDSDGGPPAASDVPMIVPTRALTEHLRTLTPQPARKGEMKEALLHLAAKPAPPTPLAPQKAPTSYTTAAAMSKPAKPILQGASKAKAQASAKPPKPAPPPPQPSLVLSLIGHTLDMTLKTQPGILAPSLVGVCNNALTSILTFTSIRVSACRWTPKGNLVVFAGPDTSRDQLSTASHLLTMAVAASLPDASVHVSSRLNVC